MRLPGARSDNKALARCTTNRGPINTGRRMLPRGGRLSLGQGLWRHEGRQTPTRKNANKLAAVGLFLQQRQYSGIQKAETHRLCQAGAPQ
jgi:hypothetical protein